MKRVFTALTALLILVSTFSGFSGNAHAAKPPGSVTVWDNPNGNNYYRIPAIATTKDGTLVAVSDLRYGHAGDLDNHRIDLLVKTSENNGVTWSDGINLTENLSKDTYGYGDAAIVADRESDKVLILAAAGTQGFKTATKDNPLHVVKFLSTDGGQTFSGPEKLTDSFYGFDSSFQSLFVTSGRIMQSRYIKVGQHYRIYTAILERNTGTSAEELKKLGAAKRNYVLYSDDFGNTWHILGGSVSPVPGGDEAKVEELPNGDVVISSRHDDRLINIFSYDKSDSQYRTGTWEENPQLLNLGEGMATNGELMVVYAKNKETGDYTYLALQSLPTLNKSRQGVAIYYKELDTGDITVSDYMTGWSSNAYMIQRGTSAYSTMSLQTTGKIAFLYEDTISNGAYDIEFISLDLQDITDGKYEMAFEGNGTKDHPYILADANDEAAKNTVFSSEGGYWRTNDGITIEPPTTDHRDKIVLSSLTFPDHALAYRMEEGAELALNVDYAGTGQKGDLAKIPLKITGGGVTYTTTADPDGKYTTYTGTKNGKNYKVEVTAEDSLLFTVEGAAYTTGNYSNYRIVVPATNMENGNALTVDLAKFTVSDEVIPIDANVDVADSVNESILVQLNGINGETNKAINNSGQDTSFDVLGEVQYENGYYVFNGNKTNIIKTTDEQYMRTEDFTIEFDFIATEFAGENWDWLFVLGPDETASIGLGLALGEEGEQLTKVFNPGLNYYSLDTEGIWEVGKEYHVSVVVENGKTTFYVDNELLYTKDNHLTTKPTSLSIGNISTNKKDLRGKIGNFTIYNKALSAMERAYTYATHAEGNEDPVVKSSLTDNKVFYNGDATGAEFFRIPFLLATSKDTLIAGTDANFGSTGDSAENIDVAMRRKENASTYASADGWYDAFVPNVLHMKDYADEYGYKQKSASFIDGTIVEDTKNDRLILLMDAWTWNGGIFQHLNVNSDTGQAAGGTQRAVAYGDGFATIEGKKYLLLSDQNIKGNANGQTGNINNNTNRALFNYVADIYGNKNDAGRYNVYHLNGEPRAYSSNATWVQDDNLSLGELSSYSLDSDYVLYKDNQQLTVLQKSQNSNYPETRVPMSIFYEDSDLQMYNTSYIMQFYSQDDGLTWQTDKIISGMFKLENSQYYILGPGRGIQLQHGDHAGRIIIPMYYKQAGTEKTEMIYSDNGGQTWKRGYTIGSGMSESTPVEMPDGSIKVYIRNTSNSGGKIKVATSVDGGVNWVAVESALGDNGQGVSTMVSAVGLSQKIVSKIDGKSYPALLVSSPYNRNRTDGRIFVGLIKEDGTYENGSKKYKVDFEYQYQLTPSNQLYGYSSITELANGKIGILYETSETSLWADGLRSMRYEEFTIDQLTSAQ